MSTSDSRFAQCLYFSANSLARKTEKLAQQSWSRVGLSPSHGYLLMLVIEEPGIQPTAIAEQLQLQPSTITRLIEKLESAGLTHRVTEGKTTCVFPSTKGRNLLPRLKECVADFSKKYQSILGRDESAALAKTIGRVADQLEF